MSISYFITIKYNQTFLFTCDFKELTFYDICTNIKCFIKASIFLCVVIYDFFWGGGGMSIRNLFNPNFLENNYINRFIT